jgi:hypothetical protein
VLKHYKILEVSPGATELEIKKAYRKQALKYHPDHNPSAKAQAKFIQIKDSYQSLLNSHKNDTRKLTAMEMADAIEKRVQDEKKERMKAYVRKMREREEEELVNSVHYKILLKVQRGIAYVTVLLAISMILIPIFSFIFEYGTQELNSYRISSFVLIATLGGGIMYGGIYLVKQKNQ